jgi:hypothetical protein
MVSGCEASNLKQDKLLIWEHGEVSWKEMKCINIVCNTQIVFNTAKIK